MSYPALVNLTILQGATFNYVVRWGAAPTVYKAITAATKAAPLVLTVTGHGAPDGWPVAISDVLGMTELNAAHEPPRGSEYVFATATDANTLTFNSIDAKSFATYTSGGILRYQTPVSLSGCTARMQIRPSVSSATTLVSLTTANSGVVLSNAAKTITLAITATATALLTFTKAVYDLEIIDGSGIVTRLLSGTVTLSKEVTR